MGVKKKAKPSPKGGKLLAKIKKAKRPVAVKKLLAHATSVVKKAVGKLLLDDQKKALKQMESLPQVDVPVTSTQINPGPPKKLTIPMSAESKAFLDTLKAGSTEIFKNTKREVHVVGTPLDSSPAFAFKKWQEHVQGHQKAGEVKVEDVKNLKLVDIAGVPTLMGRVEVKHPGIIKPFGASGSMYGALANPKASEVDIQAYEITMVKGAMPQSLVAGGWHTVAKARKDAMEHYTMMAIALTGMNSTPMLPSVPKRKLSDKAEAYRRRLRQWWRKAHKRFCVLAEKARAQKKCYHKDEVPDLAHMPSSDDLVKGVAEDLMAEGKLVGFKGHEFKFDPVEMYPYQPLYTTPPLVSAEELELVEWMNHTAQVILLGVHFDPFDKTTLLKARNMISQHFDSTMSLGGVGPPALFKTLGKQQVVHRTGLRFWHYLEEQDGKCSIEQVQLFNQVFPSEGLPATFNSPDHIVSKQQIANWMTSVAQIIFDFIHWQHPCKEVLLEVRKYIEQVYDEDLVPKLPLACIADKMIPKAGVVHRVGARVRHMLTEKYGELPDEADDLFAKIFPLPDGSECAAIADYAHLMAPVSVPKAPTFVKSAEELKAVFGEPDMTSEQAKHVAIMLKNTHEYLKAHPEAAGVGPLDGVGIVQTLAPFSAVPNKNDLIYPGTILVKKLQLKFSEEAAKDAKENGLGEEAEAEIATHVPFYPPQSAPYIEINLVIDKNKAAFLEATSDGKTLGKHPVKFVAAHLTSEGLATLDRFGVVLKGTG